MSRLGDAWAVLRGAKSAVPASVGASLVAGLSLTGRPPLRGTAELLKAYSTLPRLRAIVDRIMWSVASVPWGAYRARGGRAQRRLTLSRLQHAKHVHRNKTLLRPHVVKRMADEGVLEPLDSHPALDLINRPNPELTAADIRAIMQAHIELVGESFLITEKNALGQLAELWPVPPNWITRLPVPTDQTYELSAPNFRARVPKEAMIHLRVPDPANPYGRGAGIAASLSNELDADEYAAQTTSARFYNGALPDAIIGLGGVPSDEAQRFKEKWLEEHRGHRRIGGIHVTNTPNLSVSNLTQKIVDLDIVNLREFEGDVLRETFGIPPEIVGHLENSNRATIDAADLIMSLYVLVPRLDRLEDSLNTFVTPLFDDATVLLYESPVPDDWDRALAAAEAAPWAQSINDWREMQGRPPLDEKIGRVHLVPLGLQAVDFAAGRLPESFNPSVPDMEMDNEEDDEPESDDDEDESKALVIIPQSSRVTLKDEQQQRLNAVLDAVDGQILVDATSSLWRKELLDWIAHELESLGADEQVDVVGVLARRHLEQLAAKRIKGLVNETTRQRLRETLRDGLAEGETMRDLTARVRDVFSVATDARAENIARTETLRSSNWAITQGQKLAGITMREWIAITDGRVREEHLALSGQRRSINDAFEVGGAKAMYPGDFGRPDLDVNCRCTTAPIVDARAVRDASALEVRWKAFDQRLRVWESAAQKAFARGFRAQERAVIAALKAA